MFYDGLRAKIGYNETKYIELFINPSKKEVNELCREFDGVRGFITHDGNIFIWNPDLLHKNMILKVKDKIDEKSIRFCFNNSRNIFSIDANYEHTYSAIERVMIINNKVLDSLFNLKEIKEWNIWNTKDTGNVFCFNYDILMEQTR